MTEQDAHELSEIMAQDQTAEAFRAMARNVATYYRELRDGGVKRSDAIALTADVQSVYACKMLEVEI